MRAEVFLELRKIRNQSVASHGVAGIHSNSLAKRLEELGISVAASEIPHLTEVFARAFGGEAAHYARQTVLGVIAGLVEGRSPRMVCDPWAGPGAVIATVQDVVHADQALAFTRSEAEAAFGRLLAKDATWTVEDPLHALSQLEAHVDLFASILPFAARTGRAFVFTTEAGEHVELKGELGDLIIAASCQKLTQTGFGLFVVPSSFFKSQGSLYRRFDALGIGLEAALALPSGSFAPYASVSTYLILVRRQPVPRLFVAQLSNDLNTNNQILANLKQAVEGISIELGHFVEPASFTGFDSLRLDERVKEAELRFGVPAVRLGELSTTIKLGRTGEHFAFPEEGNAVFVPLIGISDVVVSPDEISLKQQNYAQVLIDPSRSDARFVATFLNSEFGKEIREMSEAGFIPKLNKQSLGKLAILVPDLKTQREILEIEARITAERNTLLGLENELSDLRRQLWRNPQSAPEVSRRLNILSHRLSANLRQHAGERLDEWSESLPFPLASILRAWQATSSDDFKTKYEHLLHFFEATAEFLSIILISAFSASESLFDNHKDKLKEVLRAQRLSFQRASFGTWKVVIEYLGKQTRTLLEGDKDSRATCAEVFADPTFALPKMASCKELAIVLSATNKMRNEWTGHGGVVGQALAQFRHEQLVGELQRLREHMGDVWEAVQLIQCLYCRPRPGVFENHIAILMGSNSGFLKQWRGMSTWLYVSEPLYLARKDSTTALQLLPLVRVGPSPESAKNACYFYSRVDNGDARFVSYHFIDQPEVTSSFQDAPAAMKFLAEV